VGGNVAMEMRRHEWPRRGPVNNSRRTDAECQPEH